MAHAAIDHTNMQTTTYVFNSRNKDEENTKDTRQQKRKKQGILTSQNKIGSKDPTSSSSQPQGMSYNSSDWKMALSILMNVFAKVARTNMKIVTTMNKARGELSQEQASAAKSQASAAEAGGIASTIGQSVNAAGSATTAVKGYKSMGKLAGAKNEFDSKMTDLEDQKNHNSAATRDGAVLEPDRGQGISDEEFQHKKDKIVTDYEHAQKLHKSEGDITQSHGAIINAIGSATGSMGQAQAEGAKTQAQTTASLDAQMQDIAKSAKDSAESTAQQALRLNTADVAVAAVRG